MEKDIRSLNLYHLLFYINEVAALNRAGVGVYSNPRTALTFTTEFDPLEPPIIIGTESWQREVSISWSPPIVHVSTPITGYTLSCSPSPATFPSQEHTQWQVSLLTPQCHTTAHCACAPLIDGMGQQRHPYPRPVYLSCSAHRLAT